MTRTMMALAVCCGPSGRRGGLGRFRAHRRLHDRGRTAGSRPRRRQFQRVLLGGRSIHQSAGAALTVQSLASVGEPADGYDAVLIRHGVGDTSCPITYDLVTVGPDKTFAVTPNINKCSRVLNINVEGEKLLIVTEKQNGRTEVIEYDDTQRRHAKPNPRGPFHAHILRCHTASGGSRVRSGRVRRR